MSFEKVPGQPSESPGPPRIGARVVALIGDGFVSAGLTGRITNRVPTSASVRVIWDNDTASVAKLITLKVLDAGRSGSTVVLAHPA